MDTDFGSNISNKLFGEYEGLERFFQRRVGCRQEAKDLTQETFARLCRAADRDPVEQPRGLLFRIAHNLLIDRARRQKCRPDEKLSENPAEDGGSFTQVDPLRVLAARDDLEIVQKALAALSARCREVFILSRFGGLSYPEIAEELQISTSTVEKHMIQALGACRAALKAAGTHF